MLTLNPNWNRINQELPQPDDCAPDSLSTNYLERLLRIYLMLALAADNAADHCDYLLTAQHYGVRILQSAMFSAIHMAQLKVRESVICCTFVTQVMCTHDEYNEHNDYPREHLSLVWS